jgi:pimeloyl-ACP methyl ester carboxylesterase
MSLWSGPALPPWTIGPSGLTGSPGPGGAALRGGRKTIVFVQGVATTLTTGTFDTLAARLSQPRWGYHPDTDFLTYSYNGGSVQGGRWQPEPYPCDATFQDLNVSVDRLYRLLADYHAAHPTNRFVLVAHSLGGVVSTRLMDRLAADPHLASTVEAIITNDSPVGGFPRDNINLVFGTIREAVPSAPPEYQEAWCGLEREPYSLTIVNQVAGMADDPRTARDNRQRAAWAARSQIRYATRGSDTDCLFNPLPCLAAGTDRSATQHIPGSLGRMYHGLSQIPADCRETFIQCVIATHNAILQGVAPPFGTQDTLTELLELIGPQR